MLHNLRYLEFGQPPLDEDEGDDSQGDPFEGELRATDIPELRAAPVPPGWGRRTDGGWDYIPIAGSQPGELNDSDDSGVALAPDSAVAPIGGQREMPVIRYEKSPFTFSDAQGTHKGVQTIPMRDSIPSPYKVPSAVAAPKDPGWVAGTDADNTLPFKPGALPAPAPRHPGGDRDLAGALETSRQHLATRPVLPAPKLLNRIGAGALGAAAGWSNAARRAAPIDIKAATEPILYPGYDRKLATWQSEQDVADKQVENFGQKVGAEYASQKAQSESALKFAQAEAAIKHGDYWERRSEQERNQWKIAPDGSLYNTINGQRVEKPESRDARYKAAMAITGGDKVWSSYYALGEKLPPPTQHNVSEWQSYLDANGGDSTKALAAKNQDDIHKAIASRDPSLANYRNFEELQRTQDALNRINKERVDEEQRIQSDRQAKLTALTTSGQGANRPQREAEINRAAASALQAMQQKYANGIRGAGGSAQDFDVDPVSLQWKPRVAPSNPYAPAATNPYRRAGQ